MTTITSVPRIWASDRRDPEMRAALNAGWRRHELWWERLQEQANADLERGQWRSACRRFRLAFWIARFGFDRADARRAASLANLGFVARASGQKGRAARLYRLALQTWERIPDTLDAVEIRPRARSSMFHLRMEQRHRALFQSRVRAMLAARAVRTGEVIATLARNSETTASFYPDWKAEKPHVFDDTRRILSACLLVATTRGA